MVVLRVSDDPVEVAAIVAVLEEEGIPYLIQGENAAGLFPAIPLLADRRILVEESDLGRSQEALNKDEASR